MRLNADFAELIVIRSEDYAWVRSPAAGVERMMLDRIGDEVARATSLVRYAPNSTFPPHEHGGGEEYLVLDGEFGDEHGSYPAGTYVRNPIGTSHAPRVGPDGAVIFVKLRQFEPDDQDQKTIRVEDRAWTPGPEPGLNVVQLHQYDNELVLLARLAPHTRFETHDHPGGEEALVLEGKYFDELGEYPAGTWVRSPPGSQHTVYTGANGALVYVKLGHLPPR